MSASTNAPRIVTVKIPTVDEHHDRFFAALDAASERVEEFGTHIEGVIGNVPRTTWDGRLQRPPTVEDLGSYAILVDDLETWLDNMQRTVAKLRAAFGDLDSLRLEGQVAAFYGVA